MDIKLPEIIDLLESTKIRDRTDGLARLEDINFNSPSVISKLDVQMILSLFQGISQVMTLDKLLYSKSSSNSQVEIRLIKASALMKTVASKVITHPSILVKFKHKGYDTILRLLLSHLFYTKAGTKKRLLFEPAALNILMALNHLLKAQSLKDHLYSRNYEIILSDVIEGLNLVTSGTDFSTITRSNEKLIAELFTIFYEFLSPRSTASLNLFLNNNTSSTIDNYYYKIIKVILNFSDNYFSPTGKESECLVIIFRILNQSLIDLSNVDIKLCYRIYRIGVRFLLDIKAITFESLREQIIIFINLIPCYINIDHVPETEGDNSNINPRGYFENPIDLCPEARTPDDALAIGSSSDTENPDMGITNESSVIGSDSSAIFNTSSGQTNSNNTPLITDSIRNKEETRRLIELGAAIMQSFDLIYDGAGTSPLNLDQDDFNLKLFSEDIRGKLSWFNLRYFNLKKSSNPNGWFLRLGLTRLLNSYFQLKNKLLATGENASFGHGDRPDSNDLSQRSRKRRKINIGTGIRYQLSDSLKTCVSTSELLLSLASPDSADRKLTLIGLQLFALHAADTCSDLRMISNHKNAKLLIENSNRVCSHLLKIFEIQDQTLNFWILNCFKAFVSFLSEIKTENQDITKPTIRNKYVNRLLKYTLEMIKVPKLSNAACSLLPSLLRADSNFVISLSQIDKSILQQFETLIDLSEINGPSLLSKESVMFWFNTFEICKMFRFRNVKHHKSFNVETNQLFSTRVSSWLFSRWNQTQSLEMTGDISAVCSLVMWLCGVDKVTLSQDLTDDMDDSYAGDLYDIYSKWFEKSELQNYTLMSILPENEGIVLKGSNSFEFNAILVDQTQPSKILDKLLNFVEDICDQPAYSQVIYSWFVFLCKLCITLTSNSYTLKSHAQSAINKLDQIWSDQIHSQFEDRTGFSDAVLTFIKTFNKLPLDKNNWTGRLLNSFDSDMVIKAASVFIKGNKGVTKNTRVAHTNDLAPIFDDFEFVGREQSPDFMDDSENGSNYDSPAAYSYRRLSTNLTAEQELVHYILESGQESTSMSERVNKTLAFICDSTSETKWLAGYYFLACYFEKHQIVELERNTLEALFSKFTNLFHMHKVKTYELTTVTICKLLAQFSHIWASDCDDALRDHCDDICNYLFVLESRKMLFTELQVLEFLKLQLSILKYLQVDFGCISKDSILVGTLAMLKESNNYVKVEVAKYVALLLESSDREQMQLYSLFMQSFTSPQKSFESAAAFNYFCTRLSTASDSLLISCVCNLLELSQFSHFRPYLRCSLSDIASINAFGAPKRLFWHFKEIFFKAWWGFKISFDEFPYELIGFNSYNDFICNHYKEITSFCIAYNEVGIITEICNITEMTAPVMIKDSLSLIIAMAWTTTGIRNKVFVLLTDYLGSSAKACIREQLVLIIYQLLRFCDVTDEFEIYTALKTDESQDEVSKQLLSQHSNRLYYLQDYEFSIPPKKACNTIDYLTECYGPSMFWDVPTLYFLTSRFFLLLESAVSQTEKLTHFRRLKFLIVKSPTHFKNKHLIEICVINLAKYLHDKDLYHNSSLIILSLFRNGNLLADEDHLKLWIPVLTTMIESKIKKLDYYYNGLIDYFSSNISHVSNSDYLLLLKPAVEILQDVDSSFSIDSAINVIKKCFKKDPSDELIKLMSLLFLFIESDNGAVLTTRRATYVTESFARVLYDLQAQKSHTFSRPFNLWIARCLGSYYSTTGKFVQVEDSENDMELFNRYRGDLFEDQVKLLDTIFTKMIPGPDPFDLKARTCFETIAGVIINKSAGSKEDLLKFVSYDAIFARFEEFILPMDTYVCSLSNSEYELNDNNYYQEGLEKALNGFASSVLLSSFETWTAKIFFALIKELTYKTSLVTLLATYISNIPSFAAACFSPLVLFFINSEGSKMGKLINHMINEFFSLPLNELPKKSLNLFLELVLLIRIGTKCGHKKFINAYHGLDYGKIYKAALHAGFPKASLMLMEDYYSNTPSIDEASWASERNLLSHVYSSINESDLIFGLPVDPSLSYGLDIIKHNEIKWGELMFENALFQTSLSLNEYSTPNPDGLVDGLLRVGLTGVSKVLGDYVGDSQQTNDPHNNHLDQVYERAWKLNQWDLPIADEIDTENKAIYKNFKLIYDSPDDYQSICANSLCSLIGSHSHFLRSASGSNKVDTVRSWFRALAVLKNSEDVLQITRDSVSKHYKEYERQLSVFKSSDLNGLENIIMGRKSTLELAASAFSDRICKLPNETYWLGVIGELHVYGELARSNSEHQKSINSSVYLSRVAESKFSNCNNADLMKFVTRTSKFNMASAFWSQKEETSFPVATLKNIIFNDRNDPIDTSRLPFQYPSISTGLLNALVTKWCSESRQETPSSIMNDYIENTLTVLGDSVRDPDMYHIFAEFCDNQIRGGELDKTISRLKASTTQKETDLIELEKYYKEMKRQEKRDKKPSLEAKDAQRVHNRIKVQYEAELDELKTEIANKRNYITQAIDFYLKAVAFNIDDIEDINIDRFCALWLENSHIAVDETIFSSVPTFKFLPWINQLTSRLIGEDSHFQKLLRSLVLELSFKHPFHSLYLLKSLRISAKGVHDTAILSRATAAERIWVTLSNNDTKFNITGILNLLESVNSLCDYSVNLANDKVKQSRKIQLSKLNGGAWWLEKLPTLNIPPPSTAIKVQKSSSYDANELPTIKKIEPIIMIAPSGVSHPKIMKILLATGTTCRMILKGGSDDLRQDAIMEQVFNKVNLLLDKDEQTRKRELRIRTYNVIPLGPGSGIIEFVSNSVALHDILKQLHEYDEMKIDQARNKMKEVQGKSTASRIQAYQMITSKIKPSFRKFFLNNFVSPDKWFESRLVYTHGISTTSIIGYILGLGDRHCNNILIDRSTGEPIHVDLGVAFDQGKVLPIPETIPFRLTRDIVDGMGITGTNGVFSKSCENVFRVLRMNTLYICGILDVLKYDPLYSWTLSPIRRKNLQDMNVNEVDNLTKSDCGSEASIAIEAVKNKLAANGLSNEAVVRELTREATAERNLAVVYLGWSPFL